MKTITLKEWLVYSNTEILHKFKGYDSQMKLIQQKSLLEITKKDKSLTSIQIAMLRARQKKEKAEKGDFYDLRDFPEIESAKKPDPAFSFGKFGASWMGTPLLLQLKHRTVHQDDNLQ